MHLLKSLHVAARKIQLVPGEGGRGEGDVPGRAVLIDKKRRQKISTLVRCTFGRRKKEEKFFLSRKKIVRAPHTSPTHQHHHGHCAAKMIRINLF